MPQVRIEGPEENGIYVVCTALRWFPEPQVRWSNVNGETAAEGSSWHSQAHAQDAEGLFSVGAALLVRASSVRKVTCFILNSILGQEKEMAIFVPGQHCSSLPAGPEGGAGIPGGAGLAVLGCSLPTDWVSAWATELCCPQASPWKPAFTASLIILGLLLFGAGYFIMKERSTKEQQEQENLHQTKEEERWTKEGTLKAGGKAGPRMASTAAGTESLWGQLAGETQGPGPEQVTEGIRRGLLEPWRLCWVWD